MRRHHRGHPVVLNPPQRGISQSSNRGHHRWLFTDRSSPSCFPGLRLLTPRQLVVTADIQCAIRQSGTRHGIRSGHGPLGHLERVVAAQSQKQRSGTAPPSWLPDCGQQLIVNTIFVVMSNSFSKIFPAAAQTTQRDGSVLGRRPCPIDSGSGKLVGKQPGRSVAQVFLCLEGAGTLPCVACRLCCSSSR
jgi:hypothetical protein